MNLLYMAPVYIDEEKPDGVAKKVLNQYTVFEKKYAAWLVYYGKNGVIVRHGSIKSVINYGSFHRRFLLYSEVKKLVDLTEFDAIYIRYPKSDPNFISVIKKMKESGAKIVIEIPTFPYNGESLRSIKTALIALVDGIYRMQLKRYIDRIVTYSDDNLIFGIKTIKTINGIVFDNVIQREYVPGKAYVNMIAVATVWSCHGFDRIIAGIEEYYKNGGSEEIHFNIVGNGPYIDNYRRQLSKCLYANKRVELCGFQTGKKLDELYNEANIAVNSLALHRIGLKKESTLKTKEYAAKGLPMISSCEVDAFDNTGNALYVMRVDDAETPIKMEDVITFIKNVYNDKSVAEVSRQIRETSRKVCDMEVTLQGVMNFFGYEAKKD